MDTRRANSNILKHCSWDWKIRIETLQRSASRDHNNIPGGRFGMMWFLRVDFPGNKLHEYRTFHKTVHDTRELTFLGVS